eukprot:1849588-Pleurochrysis_carterae.AAC.1
MKSTYFCNCRTHKVTELRNLTIYLLYVRNQLRTYLVAPSLGWPQRSSWPTAPAASCCARARALLQRRGARRRRRTRDAGRRKKGDGGKEGR